MKKLTMNLESSTIFLDRDGVINQLRPNDYVKKWEEFIFLPGTFEAFQILNSLFSNIIIVTNQRGVGKGIMSESQLISIHDKMIQMIENNGGRIDKIYYCTATNDDNFYRKPNPGMALCAQNDFPTILFSKSIMVGDSLSDMQFGKRLGMKTVQIGKSEGMYPTLLDYVKSIK